MEYNILGTNEKLNTALPLHVFSYSSKYQQDKCFYLKGALSHHIILTTNGDGWFKMGNKSVVLGEGDILFFKKNITCYYDSISFWDTQFLTFNGYAAAPLFNYYDFPDFFVIRDNAIGQKIKDLCIAADKGVDEESLSVSLYSLVNDIGHAINTTTSAPEYEKAADYMRRNYMNDISIADLMELTGASHTTIYRQFAEIEHTTPLKFLTGLRIEIAKMYLKSEESSIAEIAEAVGFSSCNYFIETFKKLEHITPLQYRKMK